MFIITLSRTCVQRTCLLSSTKLKARSGSGKSWSQQRKRKKIKHKPVIFLSCPWKVLRCMDGIPITAPNVCSTAWLPPTSWLNMTILGLISKATFFFVTVLDTWWRHFILFLSTAITVKTQLWRKSSILFITDRDWQSCLFAMQTREVQQQSCQLKHMGNCPALFIACTNVFSSTHCFNFPPGCTTTWISCCFDRLCTAPILILLRSFRSSTWELLRPAFCKCTLWPRHLHFWFAQNKDVRTFQNYKNRMNTKAIKIRSQHCWQPTTVFPLASEGLWEGRHSTKWPFHILIGRISR